MGLPVWLHNSSLFNLKRESVEFHPSIIHRHTPVEIKTIGVLERENMRVNGQLYIYYQ